MVVLKTELSSDRVCRREANDFSSDATELASWLTMGSSFVEVASAVSCKDFNKEEASVNSLSTFSVAASQALVEASMAAVAEATESC